MYPNLLSVFTIKASVYKSLDNITLTSFLNLVPESGFIQALCLNAENNLWVKGRIIAQAINGSSIAAVVCSFPNGDAVYVYYQDLDLHLREKIWSPDELAWVTGEHVLPFNDVA